jgi:WD40 repeat protein
MTHDAAVASLDFDHLGHRLVTIDRQGAVNVWDVVQNTETRVFRHSAGVRTLAFGPDLEAMTTVTLDGAIQVWSLATARGPRPVSRVVHDAFVSTDDLRGGGSQAPEVLSLAFSPGGRFLGMLTSEDELLVWDVRQANSHRDIRVTSGDVEQFAVNADGTLVALVMQDGSLRVVDAGRRDETATPPTASHVSAAAFEPGGRRLATVDADGVVAIREAGTWQPTTRLAAGGAASAPVWGPGGRFLAAATTQGLALIWDVRNGEVAARVPLRQKGELRALSPDGAHFATIGGGGQASVWEARSGREVARVTHGGLIQDLVFSLDGHLLATAGTDLTARVWQWRPEDLIAAACGRLTQTRLSADDWRTFLGSASERPTCAPMPAPDATRRR